MSKSAFRSSVFQSRIKKIMQSDDDVGKVAAASTVLVAQALEEFLTILLDESINIANGRNARTLTSSHLKATVSANPILDFCKDLTAHAADLPPGSTDDNPSSSAPPKRSRAKKTTQDGEESAPKRSKGASGSKNKSTIDNATAILSEDAPNDTDGGALPLIPPPLEEKQQKDVVLDDTNNANNTVDVAEEQQDVNTRVESFHQSLLEAAPGKEAEEEDYDD